MSISQNSASAAEDGLSPALLMIEEFSHRALNDYMGAICMLRGAADEVGDSAARVELLFRILRGIDQCVGGTGGVDGAKSASDVQE